MKLWLNGLVQEAGQARIAADDRGFLLGDGLFETMLAQAGEVPELSRHYQRLCVGAKMLRIPVPLGQPDLACAISKLLEANGLTHAVLRLTLTRGSGPRGLLPARSLVAPTILITVSPPVLADSPVRLTICSIRRDETSPLSRIKSLNYLPNILARLEADEQGADEALLLNHAGRVAEASTANLFVRLHDGWVTPPVEEGALPGICRAKLLESGLVKEALVSVADLWQAQALCLGNALSLRPVGSVNGCSYTQIATP